ncbi:hypothetical protein FVEG_10571 [Fusarium verticillioides 7600]|uniref:6-phosphogluconate dehydrogenase, decarboxylating n=1 Tax=Gibberella moniliformis (strain M3125 / FGSC 7600) TaxID=334819 RepID=W7MV55_GIBM7|nr:hypothetical protein FVEG_10571 [Fusarium verticillioides 7600]EWG51664.1 hypothetical protein FVEG_10571 [Fusarium verticillioides 7600]
MSERQIAKIGMVGMGSMGSMMSLLFAEKGCKVYYFDISEYNMKAAEKMVKDVNEETRVFRQHSYKQLCEEIYSENHPRIIIFSIPHGNPGDECVKALRPHMTKGDIILDCSNEFYGNTERRQADLAKDGIFYVGCGVSGGYQSARAGPSMSPGGDSQALEIIMPLLRRVAAKDRDGKPCTSPIGPGGSGHYVKMIHNGIEQGMMSVISEVWYILTKGLELSYEEAAGVFERWNQTSELYNTFLIYIAVDINRTKDEEGRYVLGRVQDKVVQDVDNTEGTGTWACEEAVRLHVPAANIVSAHLFRCTSAELSQRAADAEASGRWQPSAMKVALRDDLIEDLRKATYFCLLLCFTQGLQIIREMDQQREWHINYQDLLHVWSAGSIIQAGGIMDLLHKVYSESPNQKNNLLSNSQLEKQLTSLLPSMKRCILTALEADMVIPAMSQSLEYYKYSTSVDLPTQLTEAELDYFGNHKFDLKEEQRGEPSKGKHHFEWKPAKGESDKSRL